MVSVVLGKQKLDDAVHGVAAGSLAWMHPCRNQHDLLGGAEAEGTVAAHGKQVFCDAALAFGFATLLRGNGNEVDVATLWRRYHYLAVEVHVFRG